MTYSTRNRLLWLLGSPSDPFEGFRRIRSSGGKLQFSITAYTIAAFLKYSRHKPNSSRRFFLSMMRSIIPFFNKNSAVWNPSGNFA